MPKKNTKLTTEEIQAMSEIQQGYQQIQSTIGALHLRKYQMFQQFHKMNLRNKQNPPL